MSSSYNKGEAFAAEGNHAEAFASYARADGYEDSFLKAKEQARILADNELAAGDNVQAMIWYTRAGDSIAAKEAFDVQGRVASQLYATAIIDKDGMLQYHSDNDSIGETANLTGLEKILELDNVDGILGLDANQKPIREEEFWYGNGTWDEVSNWKDLKQFVFYSNAAYGLTHDGKVMVYQAEIGVRTLPWNDIIEIVHIYSKGLCGIDRSGSVYFMSTDSRVHMDVSELQSVKKLVYWQDWLIALTQDGQILVTHDQNDTPKGLCPVQGITGVEDILKVSYDTFALRNYDGTITMKSSNSMMGDKYNAWRTARNAVEDWENIVAFYNIGAGGIVGLDIQGKLHWQELNVRKDKDDDSYYVEKIDRAREAIRQEDVVFVTGSYESATYNGIVHIIFIHEDGSVTATQTGMTSTTREKLDGIKVW